MKSVKKAIKGAVGNQVLSFSQMETVLFKAANLVNERPIGRHPQDPYEGAYLSPNHLLLGSQVPSGPFRASANPRHRSELIHQTMNAFWRRWTRGYFPSLLVRQK